MNWDTKFGIICLVAAIIIAICHVANQGYTLALKGPPQDAMILQTHRDGSTGLLWLMALLIVTIEFSVQKYHLPHGVLFWLHLPFAAAWASLFVAMRLVLNGQDYPRIHGRLARWGMQCATVATALGTTMVLIS